MQSALPSGCANLTALFIKDFPVTENRRARLLDRNFDLRQSDEDITMFNSVGSAVQIFVYAKDLYEPVQ